MKKHIWIVIGCGLLTAILITILAKEQPDGNNIANDSKKSGITFQKPENITINNDSVIVKIIDIKGVEISLTNYSSICKKDYKSLRYNGSVLSNIFHNQKVIPIQIENGSYNMYFIDKTDEYYFDGKNAHVLLNNGTKITGIPVTDYEISGKSTYGDIAIPMENIQYAKFNKEIPLEIINKSKEDLQTYIDFTDNGYEYWPESFEKYKFSITTQANFQISINAPIFVYNYHGCDDSWIPCKSYQVWKLSNFFIPVKNGTIIMKIPINNIEIAIFNIIENEYDKEYYLDITLKNGEKLTNVLLYNGQDGYESKFCVNVGILGLIENGFAFLPVDRIKQLAMISN